MTALGGNLLTSLSIALGYPLTYTSLVLAFKFIQALDIELKNKAIIVVKNAMMMASEIMMIE